LHLHCLTESGTLQLPPCFTFYFYIAYPLVTLLRSATSNNADALFWFRLHGGISQQRVIKETSPVEKGRTKMVDRVTFEKLIVTLRRIFGRKMGGDNRRLKKTA
jgi:hypothetical protein